MVDSRKDVELRITGKDATGAASASAASNVRKVTSAIKEQTAAAEAAAEASANLYSDTSKALDAAQRKALDARRAYNEFAKSVEGVAEPTRKQVREFEGLGRAADRADGQVAKLKETLNKAEASFNLNFGKFEAAQADAAQRAGLDASSLKFLSAIEEAETAQRRLAGLNAFRLQGEQAAAAVRDINSFNAAARSAEGGGRELANALVGIVDPARLARSTLEGLEGEVTRVATVVGEADKPIRNYQDAINDLDRIQSALLRQGAAVDAFREQAKAVDRAQTSYEAARLEVLRYAEAVKTADTPNEALAASLRQSEAALTAAGRELELERTRLTALKAPLDAAKISTDDLVGAENRLRTAAGQTAAVVGKLDKAMSGQGTATGRFLGLRPFEIQNLGYQLNDVFTQLASGTSITQTFSQQAGQILQIFPGMFARIVAFIPQLAVLGAIAVTTFSAIKRVLDLQASAKDFGDNLKLSADGGRQNAQALAAQAQQLDAFGASLKDAKSELQGFVDAGLDPTKFVEYGKAAQNTADVLGIKLPEASKLLTAALSGGFEEVKKLDDATNFLTASEYDHIRAMFESGQAAEARTEVFRLFEQRVDAAAEKARGPWKDAARNVGSAWNEFLDKLSNTQPILNAINNINQLARAVQFVTKLLPGGDLSKPAGDGGLKAAQATLKTLEAAKARQNQPGLKGLAFTLFGPGKFDAKQLDDAIADAKQRVENFHKSAAAETQRQAKAESDLLDTYKDQSLALSGLTKEQKVAAAAARLTRAEEDARKKAAEKGLGDAAIARVAAAARANEQAKIDREAAQVAEQNARKSATAQRKAEAEARRDAAKAQAEENKRNGLSDQVLNDMRAMDAKISRQQKTSLQDRLHAIDEGYAKIFDTLDKFEKAGGKAVQGTPVASVRAQIEANKDLLKQQETLAFYEDSLKSLEDQRTARLREIADLRASDAISSAEAFQQAQAVQDDIGPKIAKMAADGVAFAKSIAGAKPSEQLQTFIDKLSTEGAQGNRPLRALGASLIGGQEQQLNATLAERSALLQANNELEKAGIISHEENRQRTLAAYNQEAPLIADQVAKMQQLLTLLRDQGIITSQVYDTWAAKLALVSQQAQYIDENFTKVHDTIVNSLAQDGLTAIQSIGTEIGKALDGTQSWDDALNNLGDVALNFVASFLKGLADVVAQIAIMQAIQSIPFLNGLTSGVLSFTGLATGAAALGTAGATLTGASVGLSAAAVPLTASAAAIAASAAALASAATIMLAANAASLFHTGGVVGSTAAGNVRRSISPMAFLGAPRYHSGTVGAGLKRNEQAAILKKGEEVLTADDPRHMKNWGNAGAGRAAAPQDLKIINAFDTSELISQALNTREGQKAILNFVKANRGAFSAATGGSR